MVLSMLRICTLVLFVINNITNFILIQVLQVTIMQHWIFEDVRIILEGDTRQISDNLQKGDNLQREDKDCGPKVSPIWRFYCIYCLVDKEQQ